MALFTATPNDGAVWITGGSTGIGAETAIVLADAGYTVYISARSLPELETVKARAGAIKGSIIPLALDVTDRAACEKAVKTIVKNKHNLAIAILNAGTFVPVRAFDLNFESFDKTMNVNFGGVVNCLIPAIEAMKSSGRGQVAIVSSVAGYGGLKKSASYGASKAALINMAESLKFDLDSMNIKMQIVTPGFVETPLTAKNDFKMPFLMPVEKAARLLADGLKNHIPAPVHFLVEVCQYSSLFPLFQGDGKSDWWQEVVLLLVPIAFAIDPNDF